MYIGWFCCIEKRELFVLAFGISMHSKPNVLTVPASATLRVLINQYTEAKALGKYKISRRSQYRRSRRARTPLITRRRNREYPKTAEYIGILNAPLELLLRRA